MKAKEFSDISLDSIPKGRWPDLLLDHNTQSMKGIIILFEAETVVWEGNPLPYFHHPFNILRMIDPLFFCKPKSYFHPLGYPNSKLDTRGSVTG